MDVLEAIRDRKSVRAFLPKPVSRATVEAILEVARFAPSGVNTQPWQVVAFDDLTQIKTLGDEIINARENNVPENPDYRYYPETWVDPYKSRRKACGAALYGALKIEIREIEKRKAAWYRNYHFFGAPVGLILHVDSQLGTGSWLDCAFFLENVMLAARGFGLETCPQAAFAEYPDIVRRHCGLPSTQKIICGLALGYEDKNAPVNQYRTDREPVAAFLRWK